MMQQADVERARFNMVEQQIRTWEVLDQRVLDLLFSVRREDFVPPAYRALAFADMEIPLGRGEKMLQPKLEARILQEVSPAKTDHILEVGTGSGYMTALLAAMGGHVCSVELVPDFTRAARAQLSQHGYSNVTLETGDAASGWGAHGPYDIIVLTGSVPVLSDAFRASLKPGGRLFAVIGEPPVMEATLTMCIAEGACNSVSLFETCIPPLKNAHRPTRFVF
jgi:protein-L-isoaspartate(D-aspartate) O-methyltransferase